MSVFSQVEQHQLQIDVLNKKLVIQISSEVEPSSKNRDLLIIFNHSYLRTITLDNQWRSDM